MQKNIQQSLEEQKQFTRTQLRQYFGKYQSLELSSKLLRKYTTLKDLANRGELVPEYLHVYSNNPNNIVAVYVLDFDAVVSSVVKSRNISIDDSLAWCILKSCYKLLVKGGDVHRHKLILKRLSYLEIQNRLLPF